MASHKGIGVNEVSTKCAFYAPSPARTDWNWYVTAADAVAGNVNYGRAWDDDLVLIGHLAGPFVVRGGGCDDGSNAGVLCSSLLTATLATTAGSVRCWSCSTLK